MNAKTNVTIDVRVRTRAEMNTATPRQGNWTYHHVQPVRVYYIAANLILRFITDADCFEETRVLGTNALCKMCNNQPNAATIRTFVNQNRNTITTDNARNLVAKLCASPPFGGFAGMNPAQRSDDPHDGAEPNKPISAPASWWESLLRIGNETLAAFGQHLMPAPNTLLTATKQAYEWNDVVLSLVGDIEHASVTGAPPVAYKDWKLTPGNANWTVAPRATAGQWPLPPPGALAFPIMALRMPRDQYSFLNTTDVPVPSLIRRGAVGLAPRPGGDYLDYL